MQIEVRQGNEVVKCDFTAEMWNEYKRFLQSTIDWYDSPSIAEQNEITKLRSILAFIEHGEYNSLCAIYNANVRPVIKYNYMRWKQVGNKTIVNPIPVEKTVDLISHLIQWIEDEYYDSSWN